MLSIVLVEDHTVLAQILERFISRQEGLSVIALMDSAEAALETLATLHVDLVLIDVSLPGMSGIDLVTVIQERWPTLPCLMLSGHDEPSYVQRALNAGARGYVKKDQPATLLKAVPSVMAGEIYLSEELRHKLDG